MIMLSLVFFFPFEAIIRPSPPLISLNEVLAIAIKLGNIKVASDVFLMALV